DAVQRAVLQLQDAGIRVSLFIDPDTRQIDAASKTGATVIELHTGTYAELLHGKQRDDEIERLRSAISKGIGHGLRVNAGHGLHYGNVQAIVKLPGLAELNIGHAIVAQAIFDGWEKAVGDMKALLRVQA